MEDLDGCSRRCDNGAARMKNPARLRMGDRIRELRIRRNMTQSELAKAAGLGESALRSYELGDRYPKKKHLDALAKALGVRPEAFEVFGNGKERDFIHLLFNLEEDFKLEPGGEYGTIRAYGHGKIPKALGDWGLSAPSLRVERLPAKSMRSGKTPTAPSFLPQVDAQQLGY